MKSPQHQKIIQIDITNACPHSCSNCTRFCAHHKQPFFMDFQTFQRAVDSLVDFPGMVGVMGGEPTLHPEFERFVDEYAQKIGGNQRSRRACDPIVDFSDYRTRELSDVVGRRGLWTSLGPGYRRHFEQIQEVFDYQCINDHVNPGLHQALLISRKELGIADSDWIALRDRCWVQNLWSASVTPKGAFFCEVAGALDLLFDGPGGWDLNSDWWTRPPEAFGDQLQWCELCGAALQVPRRQANEQIDDISPALRARLAAIQSPRLARGRVDVLDVAGYRAEHYACEPAVEWYLPQGDSSQRISGTNRSLYPQTIDAIIYSDRPKEALSPQWRAHFDSVRTVARSTPFSALKLDGLSDWVALLDESVVLDAEFGSKLRRWILNPGCLYYQPRQPVGALAYCAADDPFAFVLLNVRARALRSPRVAACDEDWMARWEPHKRIDLSRWVAAQQMSSLEDVAGELMARHLISLWTAINACSARVYLYGCGECAQWMVHLIRRFGLKDPAGIVADDAPVAALDQIPVCAPDAVDAPDAVVLAANTRAISRRLEARCRALWGDAVAVIDPQRGFPPKKYRKVVPEND